MCSPDVNVTSSSHVSGCVRTNHNFFIGPGSFASPKQQAAPIDMRGSLHLKAGFWIGGLCQMNS